MPLNLSEQSEREIFHVHPVQTKALTNGHFEVAVTLFCRIGPETERIGISEHESVFCVFFWVLIGTDESILGETAVVDLEYLLVSRGTSR